MIVVVFTANLAYTIYKEGDTMPNIKNISSLRQYSAVLDEVEKGSPVFLTRDGKGKYAIIDIEEYNSNREIQLFYAPDGKLLQSLDVSGGDGEIYPELFG